MALPTAVLVTSALPCASAFGHAHDSATPRARAKGKLNLNRLPEGATEKSEAAVLAALGWLARHQSPDGAWSSDGFDSRCKIGKCAGKGLPNYDVGVTGLALECFVTAGFTSQEGEYKDTVERALKYLKSQQAEEGLFGSANLGHFQYLHASAAIAMIEASGTPAGLLYDTCARKSVQWVLESQNPGRGWRYGIADGDNDTSVTGWMMMVLRSATAAGIQVDPKATQGALRFIDDMTDPLLARTGYQLRGDLPAREKDLLETFPADNSEALTAIGMLVRIWAGHVRPGDDPMLAKGAELLAKKPPKWIAPKLDFYYWYFGTLAMYQMGGKLWKSWDDAMKDAVLPHQCLDSKWDEHGSWDAVDAWSESGGRVYATAILGLCLQTCYRYDRVYNVKK